MLFDVIGRVCPYSVLLLVCCLLLSPASSASDEEVREISLLPPGIEHNVPTPSIVAVDDQGKLAYVASDAAAVIAVIDLDSGAVRTVPVHSDVRYMLVNPRSGAIFVHHTEGQISLSPRGGAAFVEIRERGARYHLAVPDPAGDGFVVLAHGGIQRYEPDGGVTHITRRRMREVNSIGVDTDRQVVYLITRGKPATLIAISLRDGSTLGTRKIDAGDRAPRCVSVHPASGRVAVAFVGRVQPARVAVGPPGSGAFVQYDVATLTECHVCDVDRASGMIAMTDDNGPKTYLIDIAKPKPVTRSISVGGKGNGVDVDAASRRALIQIWADEVVLADTSTGKVLRRLSAPSNGHMYQGVRLAPTAGLAVVAESYYGPSMVTLAPLGGAKPRRIMTGRELGQAVFDRGRLVLTTGGSDAVVVDLDRGKFKTIEIPVPRVRAIAPMGARRGLLVAGGDPRFASNYALLDVTRGKAKRKAGVGPLPLSAVATKKTVWIASASVGDDQNGCITEVDARSGDARKYFLASGGGGSYFPIDPLRATATNAWVIHAPTQALYALVADEAPRKITIPGRPQAFDIDAAGRRAWVAHVAQRKRRGPGSLSVVDLATGKVETQPLGSRAVALAVTADGGVVYVADHRARAVHRLGATKQSFRLRKGFVPLALVVDRATGDAYVAACSPTHLRLSRLTSDGSVLELIHESAGCYGRSVQARPWVEVRTFRRRVMAFLMQDQPRRGVLLDSRGGRILVFPLR